MKTGARTLALKKNRNFYVALARRDALSLLRRRPFLYHTTWRPANRYNLTKDVPASFVNEDDDHNVVKPPDSSRRLGQRRPVRPPLRRLGHLERPRPRRAKGVNLTVNGLKDQIRYQQRFRLDPEEKGIDLAPAAIHLALRRMDEEGGHRPPRKGQARARRPPLG